MTAQRHPINDRTQWLGWRRLDLTASEVGAWAGCSPYRTPLDVYAEKKGWKTGGIDNAAMERGRDLEPVALDRLRRRRPAWTVTEPKVYLRDPILRLGGTPDAVAHTSEGDVMIEVKTMSAWVFERDWADGPPLYVSLQTLTNAMLWDAHRAATIALVIDRWANLELYIFDEERNEAAEARIRHLALQFWTDYELGLEPKPDYKKDAETLAILRKPRIKAPAIDLRADNHLPDLLEERARLLDQYKTCSARLDEIKAFIVDKMAGHERAELNGWKLSNTIVHRPERLQKAIDYPVLRVTKT